MSEPSQNPTLFQDDVSTIKEHLAIYNFVILVILTFFALGAYFKLNDQILQVLTYTGCAGGIGGTIYNMRTFTSHSNEDVLNWRIWHYLFPIICIFFGVFSFMLVRGGVLVLSGDTTNKDLADTAYFYIAVAFLAGSATNQFIKKIEEIADVIFSKETPASAPEVTGVSPSTGTPAGDVLVTITGKGFTGTTAVNFGDVSAKGYTVNSDSVITATSPPNPAGEVQVTVTTPVNTSAISDNSKFTYQG